MSLTPANDDLAGGATEAGKAAAEAMSARGDQVRDIFRQAFATASYRAGNIEPDPVVRARMGAHAAIEELAKTDTPEGASRYLETVAPALAELARR